MRHAVEIGMRSDDPTRDVRKLPTAKGEGYHSWTEGEIEQFERHNPLGSRARLAFALLLYTGQRRSDVVRMGHQHIEDGGICVRQQKTGREVWIPVHEALVPILAEASANLTFLPPIRASPIRPREPPAYTDAAPTASARPLRAV
jgi:integrase